MIATTLTSYVQGEQGIRALELVDSWLTGKNAADLFRTNPLAVAAELGIDPDATIDVFLAGVLEGWFDLRWDFHCPHCNGIPNFSHGLSDSRASDFCGACNLEFRNQLDENVEVTFNPAPRLVAFADGEQETLLNVYHSTMKDGRFGNEKARLTGLQILHRPLFHERFSDEVLSVDESLEIRHVVFLFTDIKGSTRLYETLGDAKAYNLVREHFKVLFAAVVGKSGVIVKTIGDAVMASFRRPADALEAALVVQERIDALKVPGTEDAVVVKMGLHAGPAIAVTMNDRFDYFGQTVNRAARIQGLATAQEIFFSEALFQDIAIRRLLVAKKASVRKHRARLRGIEGEQIVYSVK